jgi:hypothetical protein
MSVHVGELHTDIAVTPSPAAVDQPPDPSGASPEPDWRRAEWVRARVAAEGFDD